MAEDHSYHDLRVVDVVQETFDTRTYVLEPSAADRHLFNYDAGQFCTFRIDLGDDEIYRSYSMSTAPALGEPLAVTVKLVPDGRGSGWFHRAVHAGDVVRASGPTGVFCLPDGARPVLAFAGGSGVTPIMAIIKTALATTDRRVRLLDANRDTDSVIFRSQFDDLVEQYGDRFEIRHHLDSEGGYLSAADVEEFIGTDTDVDVFICGPTPFMDLVESTSLGAGIDPDRLNLERFGAEPPQESVTDEEMTAGGASTTGAADGAGQPEVVTVILKGKTTEIGYHAGDTILETTRRGALTAPSSCEAGNCATCMALCKEGSARMRVNNALTPEEVAEGWVLTCQAIPDSPTLTVEYESY